ncbi:AbrB/MazE/SpoVT family DNA-binding domain-containing protein [Candidatus Woesearchaeota archaeon]|nr:AbrB/MazE/SpoVT family DNA-binding domain-containing protein [Candidatus Woesearchaeota archaeon]
MKRYPRIVQSDRRGQIVIPKDIRAELGIEEGSGFWVYAIEGEGILLRKIDDEELSEDNPVVRKLKEKSDKTSLSYKKIDATVKRYKRTRKGNLEVV